MEFMHKENRKRKSSHTKRRHRVVVAVLKPAARVLFYFLRKFKAERFKSPDKKQAYLVLANHTANLDPVLLSLSFSFPIYFVASDNLFRLGFISRLLTFLVAPIPIVKSRMDSDTIRTVLKVKKEGGSIGLFPEGNRCYNGVTGHFPPSTGKLLKLLGLPVLFYTLEGGYLSDPRWGDKARRGPMKGRVSGQLSAEEVEGLSADALNIIIRDKLKVDAYEIQRLSKAPYRGLNKAQHLERVLFICPSCMGLAGLKSQGDEFLCGCGYKVHYTEQGFFEAEPGKPLYFDSVLDWDLWQRKTLVQWVEADDGACVTDTGRLWFSDEEERLYLYEKGKEPILEGIGRLSFYSDRLQFIEGGRLRIIYFKNIVRMSLWGKQVLQFSTTDGRDYEFKSDRPRSSYKYIALYNVIEQKRKGMDYGFFGI